MGQTASAALQRAQTGTERLWKVWWLWGIPVGWIASALTLAGESARVAGHASWGDVCDVSRLLVYVAWARLAWRCSANVERKGWTPVSRFALAAGFAVLVLS